LVAECFKYDGVADVGGGVDGDCDGFHGGAPPLEVEVVELDGLFGQLVAPAAGVLPARFAEPNARHITGFVRRDNPLLVMLIRAVGQKSADVELQFRPRHIPLRTHLADLQAFVTDRPNDLERLDIRTAIVVGVLMRLNGDLYFSG